jgi:hypothetical protein
VRFRPWSLSLVLLVAASPNDPVLVRVGDSALTHAELKERLAALPPARLQSLPPGSAGVRAYVNDDLVPELLLLQHAASVKLPAYQRDRALAFALEAQLSRSVTIDDAEVANFYGEHHDAFETPEALSLWRIVTDSEEEAREVLSQVRGQAKGAEIWSSLARDRSLDAATKMRRGDLGFVRADGHTDVPQVRVNPAVFQAAAKLSDGQLAPEPVRDGEHYSALWRRGSRPAVERSLEQASDEVRRILLRRKSEQALQALLAKLRKEHVSSYAPDQLESVDYGQPDTLKTRRPLVQRPASGPSAPRDTPTGER